MKIGITTGNVNAIPVVIDSAGQLGTVSSSRRFKEDIGDMGDMSRRLYDLRPVTFRYTQAYTDGSKPINYGLVAEEVADAFPELAVRGADGEIETVHYETLNVLLLNELQAQQRRIEKLEQLVATLLRTTGKQAGARAAEFASITRAQSSNVCQCEEHSLRNVALGVAPRRADYFALAAAFLAQLGTVRYSPLADTAAIHEHLKDQQGDRLAF